MYDDKKLRIFVTLSECGSFTAAAQRLGISQPAVSLQMAELEKALGTELIDHSSRRGVKVTPAGETVLHYARTILGMYDSMARALTPEGDARPATILPLDSITDARIWADDGGFFHLELIHKN